METCFKSRYSDNCSIFVQFSYRSVLRKIFLGFFHSSRETLDLRIFERRKAMWEEEVYITKNRGL